MTTNKINFSDEDRLFFREAVSLLSERQPEEINLLSLKEIAPEGFWQRINTILRWAEQEHKNGKIYSGVNSSLCNPTDLFQRDKNRNDKGLALNQAKLKSLGFSESLGGQRWRFGPYKFYETDHYKQLLLASENLKKALSIQESKTRQRVSKMKLIDFKDFITKEPSLATQNVLSSGLPYPGSVVSVSPDLTQTLEAIKKFAICNSQIDYLSGYCRKLNKQQPHNIEKLGPLMEELQAL